MLVKINGWPVSSPYHAIDSAHAAPHQGVDFAIPNGTSVPSVTDGIVTRVVDEGTRSFGKSVTVHTLDGKDVVYGHLSQQNVHVGQHIHSGDIVGLSGNTGHSTGPHLHIQLMEHGAPIDPTPLIQQRQVAWWDISGQLDLAGEHLRQWVLSELHNMVIALLDSIEILLPTLALAGVIWWMCPLLPKSDKAPKLVGTSMIVYMFYALMRGAY